MSRRNRKPRKGPSLVAGGNYRPSSLIWERRSNSTGLVISSGNYDREHFQQTDISHSARVVGDGVSPYPWSYRIWRRTQLAGEGEYNYGTFTDKFGGATYSPAFENADIPIPEWDRPDLYNRALDRLNEKVRGQLDLAVSLAEAGQTKRMLAATTKAEGYLKTLKSFGSLGRLSGEAAKRWLEWNYGWKPLANDLYGAADESLRLCLNKISNVSGSASESIPDLTHTVTTFYGFGLKYTVKYNGKQGYRIHVALENPEFDPARWSSLNPVSIAWELVPYSFVVDWFYDIGSFLRNVETGFLYSMFFKNGFVSQLQAFDATGSGQATASHGFERGTSSFEYRRFARSPLASYPFPRKPTLSVDLGSSRLLSAASLLRLMIKR
jgi:hypothetical protein